MSQISVAAVIPLYNGAPFIREAIESVLNQTVQPDEIIVVNDGSTDEGPNIVAEMARCHPITLLHKANGGQSSARNMAILHSRCTHIALLDQDDAWYEDHIEILRRPFMDGKIRRLGLVYGNLDQIDRAGHLIQESCLDVVPSPQPKRSLLDCLRHDMFILPGASLVSRQAVIDLGMFDERLSGYEDDDLFVRLFSAGYRSVYINQPVSRWRIYSGSASFSARMAESRIIYFRKLLESYPDDPSIDLYWGRHVIAPRFMALVRHEFIRGSKTHDVQRMKQSWADIRTIAPTLRRRVRMRIRLWGPVIEATYRGPLTGIARALVRRASRC